MSAIYLSSCFARPPARLYARQHACPLLFCSFLPVSSFEVEGGHKKVVVILINLLHAAVRDKSKANDGGEVMSDAEAVSAAGVQGPRNNGAR